MKSFAFACLFFVSLNLFSQDVPVWKFKDLEKQFQTQDTLIVINFWATWCKPCVTELPYIESAAQKFKNRNVKFILVSLDFRRELEKRVIPFISDRQIKLPVVLLDEPDYNSWINKVDTAWTGGIPATLIIDNRDSGVRKLFEKEFQENELTGILNDFLNR